MILTPADLLALCQRHGATPDVSRIAAACALVESGGDTDATGDNGHSRGIWQMHDAGLGTGMTVAERQDPDTAADRMLPVFEEHATNGAMLGYADEMLARYVAIWTERPEGWPWLDSPAADKYAAMWQTLGETPMPEPRTYDPSTPTVAQTDAWSCSVASLCWALHSIGIAVDYDALEQEELAAGIVSTEDGLLVASGGPLADWITARFGVPAHAESVVSWAWLQAAAGSQPILLGGRHWGGEGHWVGVRDVEQMVLTLANPAEGYAGIWSTLTEEQFNAVSPCSAVWLVVEESEDMGKIDDLTNLLGLIQGDWADAVESAIVAAKAEPRKTPRNADLDAALAALATIRRGGAPEEGS